MTTTITEQPPTRTSALGQRWRKRDRYGNGRVVLLVRRTLDAWSEHTRKAKAGERGNEYGYVRVRILHAVWKCRNVETGRMTTIRDDILASTFVLEV